MNVDMDVDVDVQEKGWRPGQLTQVQWYEQLADGQQKAHKYITELHKIDG